MNGKLTLNYNLIIQRYNPFPTRDGSYGFIYTTVHRESYSFNNFTTFISFIQPQPNQHELYNETMALTPITCRAHSIINYKYYCLYTSPFADKIKYEAKILRETLRLTEFNYVPSTNTFEVFSVRFLPMNLLFVQEIKSHPEFGFIIRYTDKLK